MRREADTRGAAGGPLRDGVSFPLAGVRGRRHGTGSRCFGRIHALLSHVGELVKDELCAVSSVRSVLAPSEHDVRADRVRAGSRRRRRAGGPIVGVNPEPGEIESVRVIVARQGAGMRIDAPQTWSPSG